MPSPYLPMVKAIAPNAPIGASFITKATILKITIDNCSNALVTRAARSPTIASATPNRIAASNVWRMLPAVSAETKVSGMMSSRKPVSVVACALSA